ncbi:MAG: hypothetical protein M1820_007474 [Bogoriella megaspora]|nr:MAG: hypothetical protein M1820_007474 [Bogoriella megaspora]
MNLDFLIPEIVGNWTRQHPPTLDAILSDTDLTRKCPLDNGRHAVNPVQDLGRLSALPLEVLTDILLYLDIISLTTFRQVNNCGMLVVDSIPQYKTIYKYCPHVLRGVISIGATHFDLRTLYQSLYDFRCGTCGNFGGYLYLITCSRVCYTCFTRNNLFLPMTEKCASMSTSLPRNELKKLPHIKSIPDQDGLWCQHRLTLWDRGAVMAVSKTTSVCEEIDNHFYDMRRFVAVVSVPYFEPPSTVARWGFYCFGCSESHENSGKQYTKQDFLDHIVRYGPVVTEEAEDGPRHSPWGQALVA